MAGRPDVSRVWASGSPQNIIDPDTREAGKVVKGWEAEIPPFEFFNWIQNNNDLFKLALTERGIPSWGSDVTYQKGALSFSDDDNRIYIAQKVNKGQVPTNNSTYWIKSAIQITQADIDSLSQTVQSHLANVSNPHVVTAEQVGAYTKAQIDKLLADKMQVLATHESDYSNPHKVTATQAGGVPITGGTYTGQINTKANKIIVGKGLYSVESGIGSSNTETYLYKGGKSLGVDSTIPYYFDGTTKHELIPTTKFAELKLREEPKYAVPRPEFWMPLSSDINIYEGEGMVTFERASTATYMNKQGVLTVAQANEPRFEEGGILIEGRSTNLFLQGENTHVSYISNLSDLTLTNGVSHDGVRCSRIVTTGQVINATVDFYPGHTHVTGISGEGRYSLSFFIEADDKFTFINGSTALANATASDIELKTVRIGKYIRLIKSFTVTLKEGFSTWSGTILGFKVSASEASEIYISRGQLEKLPFATSYIPTNGTAVTRTSDSPLGVDLPVNFGKDYSISFEWDSFANSAEDTHRCVFRSVADWNLAGSVNARYGHMEGGRSAMLGATYVPRTRGKFASSSTDTVLYAADNLSKKSVSTYAKKDSSIAKVAKFQLGSRNDSYNLFGHIKNFRLWTSALTPEQISTL